MVTSHGETQADDDNAFGQSALLRSALRSGIARARTVTAPSAFVLADLQARFGLSTGVVIPNGVDWLDRPSPVQRRDDARLLLGVGRLGRNKGFDLLLRAFARARLADDMQLVIAGDGPERTQLTELARTLGVQGRVQFAGWMDAATVAATMAEATAVVIPSRVEAFGIVALEAWRGGAPLVMTSRGGAAEFVRDGVDALLVDPTRVEDLAGALERVALDTDLRRQLSSAGWQRLPEFTWAQVAAQYLAIYDSVVVDAAGLDGR